MNYYEILNINTDASLIEIKKSYKKLVFKYHPDKNKNDSAPYIFNKIQEAFNTLSDTSKRDEYDISIGINRNSEINYYNVTDFENIYYDIISELIVKYNLSNEDKHKIFDTFNFNTYKRNIDKYGIDYAVNELIIKIMEFIPKITIKKISESHPNIGQILTSFYGLF
ncbi:putative J domain-containing protein [Cotonvirus japonicus]|uniref:J domain-containing protein n=1 Tax=Cotonvirus japonicus TaxID=2811091 RepID=A0ABM7NSA7_9VIRU|nr:putative J domain-containing protein [Cotonvirus japonicus]BCS83021.1 putative J domain-containing protein [Cotonvirus japonicus]